MDGWMIQGGMVWDGWDGDGMGWPVRVPLTVGWILDGLGEFLPRYNGY